LKIAGVVSNYKEALDFEDIVRVFIIEKRILNLPSLENKEKLTDKKDSNIMIFQTNDIELSENSNKKITQSKNDEEIRPVFNVRGLV
jgi:hypothetical protein